MTTYYSIDNINSNPAEFQNFIEKYPDGHWQRQRALRDLQIEYPELKSDKPTIMENQATSQAIMRGVADGMLRLYVRWFTWYHFPDKDYRPEEDQPADLMSHSPKGFTPKRIYLFAKETIFNCIITKDVNFDYTSGSDEKKHYSNYFALVEHCVDDASEALEVGIIGFYRAYDVNTRESKILDHDVDPLQLATKVSSTIASKHEDCRKDALSLEQPEQTDQSISISNKDIVCKEFCHQFEDGKVTQLFSTKLKNVKMEPNVKLDLGDIFNTCMTEIATTAACSLESLSTV